jgi:hypothetical protein
MRVIRDSVRKTEDGCWRRGWLVMQAENVRMGLGLAMAAGLLFAGGAASAADAVNGRPEGLLETIHRHTVVTSTIAPNGDQNPYAVIVAPVSAGKVQKDDVLITNFNNAANLQGLGTTIVDWNPTSRRLTTLAAIPRHLPSCPGGVGLSTALTMLKTGWIIVGSTPSQDGTTGTKGPGCLLVLDPKGNVVSTFAGPNINDPWGNMAVVDNGATATLFVSMTGFGVESPGQPTVNKATVLRIDLAVPQSGPPTMTKQTVVATGLGERPDKDVFVIGPTGLSLGKDGTLYVSDAIENRVVAIPDAVTRTTDAGVGREVTKGGFLKRPLAMIAAPNDHLLVINGTNGQIVEIDPATGTQLYAQWIDPNRAQQPPGNGDLFGVAMTPSGDGFYYVEDEIGALALAH